MEGINRVHELVEQLTEECKKVFPEANDFSFIMHDDGFTYMTISVTDRDENLPVEAWKTRYLLIQSKSNGKWGADFSKSHNEYLGTRKRLLEGA